MKKPRKSEPSLRDRLSKSFLEALSEDFAVNGPAVIERMRETHPERYAELAAKLIMTAEPPSDGFEQCQSMEEIGVRLLRSVGLQAPTDEQIEAAILANDKFIARLEQITRDAQGELDQ